LSPDGSRLAASSHKTARIWDPATGQTISSPVGFTSSLEFDKDDLNLLKTNFGTYEIGSIGPLAHMLANSILPPKQHGYNLSEGRTWVTYNGLKLLWLPTEYCPYSENNFARYASILAIGCGSGHVIFLALTPKKLHL
jgi:hypothetical protein